jgi:hypothetical protein
MDMSEPQIAPADLVLDGGAKKGKKGTGEESED